MGILSFLTKKGPGKQQQQPGYAIKTQAYDATTAAGPPVKGSYPVTGNGRTMLDKLQQSSASRKRGDAQLSLFGPNHDPHPQPHPAAPSPRPHRIKALLGRRPTTAPNTRPKSRPPRAVSPATSATSTPSRAGAEYETSQVPPVPPIPMQHQIQHRPCSTLDGGPTDRFVDILDAQGEIKPSDFRSRVKASGTRDYGEDVAERNLGENGVDLNSAAVQAFYALADGTRGRPRYRSQPAPFTRENAYRLDPHPAVTKGGLPRDERVNQRKSFNTFISATRDGRSKSRPLSFYPSVSSLEAKQSASRSKTPPRPRTSGNMSTASSKGVAHEAQDEEEDEAFDITFHDAAPSPNVAGRARVRLNSLSRLDHDESWDLAARLAHGHGRPSSSSSAEGSYPRSLGGTSIPGRPRLEDITEHIPARSSSLAHTCLTPTSISSEFSINPFARPRSHHTANTSIDASGPASSVERGYEPNLGKRAVYSRYHDAGDDDALSDEMPTIPRSLAQSQHRSRGPGQSDRGPPASTLYSAYGSDDSEADSFVESQLRRAADEEGLLFDEAVYRDLGSGLPGLFDAIPPRISPNPIQSAGRSKSKATTIHARSHENSRPRRTKTRSLRRTAQLPASKWQGGEQSADEEDPQAVLERLEAEYLRAAGLLRLTDLGIEIAQGRLSRAFDAVGEAHDGRHEQKVDARTASRMRRERRKQRASELSPRNQPRHRSMRARSRRDGGGGGGGGEGSAADDEEY